jgi:uncharacterized membrane protein YphA (DoxX/SURF4 family)
MELFENYHYAVGTSVARIFLGFLFFFQGYDAVFKIGLKQVTDTYQEKFGPKGIPRFLTALTAQFTSFTALLCGFLLIFGMFEFFSLYLLGLNLIITGIGFGMNLPLWDTRHVFPRLSLLLLLLLTPLEWHFFTLDQLFIHH